MTSQIEEWMRNKYDASAKGYRKDDDLDVTGGDHQKVAAKLANICCSFKRPINVLEIGCGTGRYFHALQNVEKLVGMDVSEEMLVQARNPVKNEEVTAKKIELLCGNFYKHDFPNGSFDFIYAIGVFGNGCPITGDVTRKFYNWLKPGGRLFFDVLDSANLPPKERFRKWLRSSIYLQLPASAQTWWDKKTGWPPLFLISHKALEKSMLRAGFTGVGIERCFTRLPLGDAWKLQCLALKGQ
jgi:ubiquinone/menaquinone biosynthesis C-methylase UbiE